MANANVPRGLYNPRHRNGAPYNGGGRIYHVPASYGTALYIGDPVIIVTDASDANGIQTVARASAGGGAYAIGAIIGMASRPEAVWTQDKGLYRPASTLGYVLVADDPDLLFEIQEDSVGGVMTIGAVGRNADLIAGSGSAVTGWSGFQLDSSTLQTTNTLQLRIVDALRAPDNDPGDTYAKWLVSINLHSLRNLTGV